MPSMILRLGVARGKNVFNLVLKDTMICGSGFVLMSLFNDFKISLIISFWCGRIITSIKSQ